MTHKSPYFTKSSSELYLAQNYSVRKWLIGRHILNCYFIRFHGLVSVITRSSTST